MENLDKALADAVEKIGATTPGAIEKIVTAYTEVNIAYVEVGFWAWPVSIALFLIIAVIAFLSDEYGGGKILSFISALIAFGCFVGFADTIQTAKNPGAHAIKEITKSVLDNKDQ